MEKINVLGTGAGITVECYSTCFTIQNDENVSTIFLISLSQYILNSPSY